MRRLVNDVRPYTDHNLLQMENCENSYIYIYILLTSDLFFIFLEENLQK